MSLTLSASQAELKQVVQPLHAFARSLPKDRPPDDVDRDLAARNVLSTHERHVQLRQTLSKVCEEQHCSEREAIMGIID